MLAVTLAASGIAHDAAYIFARRRMTRARMLRISLFALLALWRLGGWVWSVAAMAMVAVLLLFALAFCKAASSADPDGADDWWGE